MSRICRALMSWIYRVSIHISRWMDIVRDGGPYTREQLGQICMLMINIVHYMAGQEGGVSESPRTLAIILPSYL